MKAAVLCIIGLVGSWGHAAAESQVEGRVRLGSGVPVPGAQVLLFDLADLRAAPLAATTDRSGHFTLPLATLAGALPERFELGANYPNPFNPSTMIPYQLPAAMHVRLEVFNILGQRVATLVDGERPAGFHTASWDATDAAGEAMGAGVYLYRLSGDGVQATRSMLLIDGQAGIASGGGGSTDSGGEAGAGEDGEAAPVYGLTVSGPGLVPYVDPAFRVEAGMAPLDLVVEAPTGAPLGKVASSGGILGDVDNTGDVDFFDALLVALYSHDSSTVMPNNGDISLGDVDADGQVDLSDAWAIAAYLSDPSDPSLPAGIGEPAGPAASLSPEPSTVTFADDGAWHRFTVAAGEPVSVVANPEGTPRGLEITTLSGRGNYCPAEADDDQSRQDGQTIYLSGCSTGQATVELRRESDGTVLRTYTFEVTRSPADLVVESVSVSDSTLTPGQSFTLNATVRNQGTAGADATTLRWYRSSNRRITTQDTRVGTNAVGALGPAGTSAESIRLTAPSSAGTYYYGACAVSVAGESAGNNCSTEIRVRVEALSPDLIVETASVTNSSLTPGQSFTLSATVRNQGTGRSAATTLNYYRSSDATISTRDTEVGTDVVGALVASGTSAESVDLTAPSSEGSYYYGACVATVAGETDTGNNCSIGVGVMVEELDTTPVTIPDVNLRAAVEAALGKASGAPITQAEMATLDSLVLNAYGREGIRSLSGIESATNVWKLNLRYNSITDISPLAGLNNLTWLDLAGNDLTDISPLAGLTNLTWLGVGGNHLTDVSSLAGWTNLRTLRLGANNITDISPLAGLTNLTELHVGGNPFTDVSSLAGLTNLTWLGLSANNITDISPLAGLTNLTNLQLSVNGITDISPLEGLTNLRTLWLFSNSITDISALAGLNLWVLNLGFNPIVDISALSGLTNLGSLNLEATDITDISALAALTGMGGELDLGFNFITDISALSGLTNLRELDLRGNPLNDSSIDVHIPFHERNGATVTFNSLREGDFDIELVFLDSFTERHKRVFQFAARRWMSAITEDLPDYEFAQGWSGRCGGQSYEISAGERIDDLRIYVISFDIETKKDEGYPSNAWGGPSVLRDETHLPVVGCMGFGFSSVGAVLVDVGLHEVGHVLGFGTVWNDLGFFQNPPGGDEHFNGPLAIAAFDDAGGGDYTGAKVPVEFGFHWRSSVLEAELMGRMQLWRPSGAALSAITVQSFADLGYGVDVTQADPYTLPGAASAKASAKIAATMPAISGVDVTRADAYSLPGADPHWLGSIAGGLPLLPGDDRWRGHLARSPRAEPELSCGAGLRLEPIHVVDPQGRIVRTLGY